MGAIEAEDTHRASSRILLGKSRGGNCVLVVQGAGRAAARAVRAERIRSLGWPEGKAVQTGGRIGVQSAVVSRDEPANHGELHVLIMVDMKMQTQLISLFDTARR
jgi:hypothetical protein